MEFRVGVFYGVMGSSMVWVHQVGFSYGSFGGVGVEVQVVMVLGLQVGLSCGSFGGFSVDV